MFSSSQDMEWLFFFDSKKKESPKLYRYHEKKHIAFGQCGLKDYKIMMMVLTNLDYQDAVHETKLII